MILQSTETAPGKVWLKRTTLYITHNSVNWLGFFLKSGMIQLNSTRLATYLQGASKSARRRQWHPTPVLLGFPGGSAGKESACNAGDLASIPGLGRRAWQPTPAFLPG